MRTWIVIWAMVGGWACEQDPWVDAVPDAPLPGEAPDGDDRPDDGDDRPPRPDPAADLPALPDAEPFADGVFRGVGSVLAQISGEGPVADRLTLEVELLAADGAVLERLTAPVQPIDRPGAIAYGTAHAAWRLEEGEWLVQAWWPGDWPATRARTRLMERDQVQRAGDWDMAAVPIAEGDCDPSGVANRCGDGMTCSLLPRPVVGACHRAEMTVWRGDETDTLQVISGPNDYGSGPWLSVVRDGRVEPLQRGVFDPARYPVDAPNDTFTLYANAHRVILDVAEPVLLRDGDACDREGVVDRCPDGLICGAEATCKGLSAPAIDAVAYNVGRVWATVHLRATDAEADYAAIELRDGDRTRTYALDGWLDGPALNWHIGYAVDARGALELVWAIDERVGDLLWDVEVVLIDTEGNRSAPVRAQNGFLPDRDGRDWLPEGALCDAFQSGMLGTCEDRRCGLIDGETAYRCLPAPGECAAPARFLPLDALPAEVPMTQGASHTKLPCSPFQGADQGFVYTAREEGIHRITVTGRALLGLSLRQTCDRVGDGVFQSICSGAEQPSDTLILETWLDAGATRYLVVEAAWASDLQISAAVRQP